MTEGGGDSGKKDVNEFLSGNNLSVFAGFLN